MTASILDTVKKALGLDSSYTPFDMDIIMHINSAFSDLHQLGAGPPNGFEITDKNATWDQFIGNETVLNNVKSYVWMSVKLKFDPPSTGYLVTSMEKLIDKSEFRIKVAMNDLTTTETVVLVEEP